ncbi:CRISPR-associated endonuclease Cas1 [Pauljensenia sp. UMB0018B]|nr:CRISPR-associated endonuclease Cas1 [Schaalia odontolytica]MDK7340229.1 CRISPR-associated endonuclease Cas1 [Pauljensenia sp. UMB0018B]
MSVLADAALLDLDRYATGRGLRYSRVGTTLMLAAPTKQRLTDAIDTIAAVAINTGARVTDLTAQYIDDEKALASVGIDLWTTRPSDDSTGHAGRIFYVGRDGAHIHVKAGRIIVDATARMYAWRRSLASVRTLDEIMGIEGACSNAYFDALAVACPPTSLLTGAVDVHPASCPTLPCPTGT